jgi:hypothetical protein
LSGHQVLHGILKFDLHIRLLKLKNINKLKAVDAIAG